MAVAAGMLLGAGAALAVNKDPPPEKVGPPREEPGPPCVPQQDYSGHYSCTDPNGVRYDCTIQGGKWDCKVSPDQPPKEPTRPKKP